jgi:hypothetical protein
LLTAEIQIRLLGKIANIGRMAGKGDPFEAQALMRRTEHISLVVIAVLYQG